MAYMQVHLYSRALNRQTQVGVIMPQRERTGAIGEEESAKKEPYRSLYLLHGLGDDGSIWQRRTSIERYADEYGVCVIMPDGGRSFYMNERNGQSYYDYVAKELPLLMGEFFNLSERREDRYVAGNSMGGYGALKIALKERERFGGGAGLSPVADVHMDIFREIIEGAVGKEKYLSDEEDLFALATKYADAQDKPRLFTSCGKDDFLYPDNVKLRKRLQACGYDCICEEHEGTHEWGYWDKHIQRVLQWAFGQ